MSAGVGGLEKKEGFAAHRKGFVVRLGSWGRLKERDIMAHSGGQRVKEKFFMSGCTEVKKSKANSHIQILSSVFDIITDIIVRGKNHSLCGILCVAAFVNAKYSQYVCHFIYFPVN